jgi:hypothetical protein
MAMKRIVLLISSIFIFLLSGYGQVKEDDDHQILFRGMVIDANTLSPISNSQIMINNAFSSLSSVDGSFLLYVTRHDSVTFRSLGYKESVMYINDTLQGSEFIAGIYLNTDTVYIGDVIIVPGYKNLKSEIMNAKSITPQIIDNARYNVAVSAYQGKNSISTMGDPIQNYAVINQRQKTDAFEKGGIPSNNMVGLNTLLFLPAFAYMLLNKPDESVAPMAARLSDQEVAQLHKKYLEMRKQKK